MPFVSERQRRFLFARKPEIARRFVEDARRLHKPLLKKLRRKKR